MTGAVTDAMGKMARSVVGTAVEAAVARVTRKPKASAPARRKRAA